MSRFRTRRVAFNDTEQYHNLFKKRGIKSKIRQYRTLSKDVYEQEVYDAIETMDHVWKQGDKYWKLSQAVYGSPDHWWVIASFNKRPTESHNTIGDTIKIPLNLADALQVVS